MRIPLLFGADPRVAKRGPDVQLGEGRWRVIAEAVKTRVGVHNSSMPSQHGARYEVVNGDNVFVEGPCVVHVAVLWPGDENHVSVFAELAGGVI
jgi:hypothetical protein